MNIGIPECCPVCGGKLEIIESKNGIKDLFCTNEQCPARFNECITAFLERLGVMGVSNTTMENWNITGIKDVVNFTPDQTSKNEVKFEKELEKKMWSVSKKDIFIAMSAFVYGVGRTEMGKFWDKFGGEKILDDSFVQSESSYVKEGLIIKNIPMLRSICKMVFENAKYNPPKDVPAEQTNSISTKGTICFTGKLETMTRSEAQAKAKELGYEIADSVSKTLGTLVVADAGLQGSPSSKLKKAMSMGIKIIGETEFNSLFN